MLPLGRGESSQSWLTVCCLLGAVLNAYWADYRTYSLKRYLFFAGMAFIFTLGLLELLVGGLVEILINSLGLVEVSLLSMITLLALLLIFSSWLGVVIFKLINANKP